MEREREGKRNGACRSAFDGDAHAAGRALDHPPGVPNKDKVGKVTKAQLDEIVRLKTPDLNARDGEYARRMIEGTARSMGITVEG